MTARLDTLICDGYSVMQFAAMPTPYQLAIVWHMAVDGCAWDGIDLSSYDEEELKSELVQLLPQYVEVYGKTLFGSACMSTSAIQKAIMRDAEIADEFSSWDEYHARYLSGGDVPEHPGSDRWPVILSSDESETLRDGWHRLHSYIRDGAREIYAVFHPENHHLAFSLARNT